MLVVLGEFKPNYEEGDSPFLDHVEKQGIPEIMPYSRQIM